MEKNNKISEKGKPSPELRLKEDKESSQLAWIMGLLLAKSQPKDDENSEEVLRLTNDSTGPQIDVNKLDSPGARIIRRDKTKIKSSQPDIFQIIEQGGKSQQNVEASWDQEKKATPIGWFALLGIVMCGVGLWAIYDVFQFRKGLDVLSEENALIATAQAKEARDVRFALENMQDCAKGYLEAESVRAMLPFVRHPERVGPLMQDYYKNHKRWRRKFERFEQLRAVNVGSKSFVYVNAVTEVGKSQNLLLEQMEDGNFRIDWESDVIYQPMPWSEYLSKRPLAPMDMRVKVQEDDFYGFAFRDAELYQCYQLTTVGSEDYLFGYVEKNSPVAKQIDELIKRGSRKVEVKQNKEGGLGLEEVIWGQKILKTDDRVKSKPEPMILRIRFLRDDVSKRCVMIDALLAERWIYENSPELSR